ncbi:hypothetical protein IRJ41_008898 [Triplophysa rosa]|uniref:DUF5641 domain-containing protein n=1 Tax=Triplophysa rosa TaxID=992332 RepID=A0A9W7X2F0_TRIRA|nr:hypothetical protein IRJ41_008898 [Triplophysa rosa]
MLEEKVKALELEEMRRQCEEDITADKECQRLDEQTRDALKAREALAKQIETRRRLKKAQNALEVAKLAPPVRHPNPRMAFPQSMPSYAQPAQAAIYVPQAQPPGLEMLAASAYGKPVIPTFETGRESDFALLKMALDNIMNNQQHPSEQYKYQVLLGHLKLPSALKLAKAYMHDPLPYTAALQSLQDKYGQPRQLVQCELGAILNAPAIKFRDAEAFDDFAMSIHSLVGMLRTLEGPNGYELRCGSHVDRLLSKMQPSYRDSFVKYCFSHGILQTGTDRTYTLLEFSAWAAALYHSDVSRTTKKDLHMPSRPKDRSTSILYSANSSSSVQGEVRVKLPKFQPYCPYCSSKDHFLNSCSTFKLLNMEQIMKWITDGKRCWKCGRTHSSDNCTLKRGCKSCKELHLTILHEAALQSQRNKTMEAYAVLDDGSERSIVLPQAVEQLNLTTEPETLTLSQDVIQLNGASVSLAVSPLNRPSRKFQINHAFTAENLRLSEHTYPVAALQHKYAHIRSLPLPQIERAQPLLLIGSDMPHLLLPVKPVRMGPVNAPIAVHTRLGWTLQGPVGYSQTATSNQQCLHISVDSQNAELIKNVERLWQTDTLPYLNETVATHSKQDRHALTLLQTHTARVEVDGLTRYATPLLRHPKLSEAYCMEMKKLQKAGYLAEISSQETEKSAESWYIPHHIVEHSDKNRISLNDQLLPGPILGPSLLGFLLRFRQHTVAVSGDVKGMFRQFHLLPQEKTILCFIWRNMQRTEEPKIYEWQVLPFGTTCSPCCAIFALQQKAHDSSDTNPMLEESVTRSFYVDNCLQSLETTEKARALVNGLRQLLLSGGFDLRQWASNKPEVIEHPQPEARSQSSELWLSQKSQDLLEGTLGLRWNCLTDSLGYRSHRVESLPPTLRNIYKVLASQYDPLGYLIPFTTQAKVLIQDLWKHHVEWDEFIESDSLRNRWQTWQQELSHLQQLEIPRCYTTSQEYDETCTRDLHIFCDASERAYGAVSYMRTEDRDGKVHISFVLSRSRVAPKKQMSIPRLELSAALTGAQIAKLLQTELTIAIRQSDSCRYKVFVGTRVAEIQSLTDIHSWRYVDSGNNPADDITRGKSLRELTSPCRWIHGPDFLHQSEAFWPTMPVAKPDPDTELKKSTLCLHLCTRSDTNLPDINQFSTWKDLVKATVVYLHGAAQPSAPESDEASIQFNSILFYLYSAFHNVHWRPHEPRPRKPHPPKPCRSNPVPFRDQQQTTEEQPGNQLTKLLIKEYDANFLHPGPERVLAEFRRQYWILRGRAAIKKHQITCMDCQKWRAQPTIPKMADLPPARLRLCKPPFYSTGMDCFGPFTLLESLDTDAFLMSLRRFIARRGKPFEFFSNNGTNFVGGSRELKEAYGAMAPKLKEHLAHRPNVSKIDQSIAIDGLATTDLAEQKISFRFNPRSAPHFGGIWEREVKSVKQALKVILKERTVPETVLRTVLIEVEGIMNAKPLGYVSSDIADPDPITPSILLLGRHDSSLPQVIYDSSNLLGTRRWRYSQILADQFWTRFIHYYLPNLQERQKWQKDSNNLSIEQAVLIVDPQLPRALWPVGKVTRIFPGPDGLIRTVEVQVQNQTYRRPVARLIPLPKLIDESSTSSAV